MILSILYEITLWLLAFIYIPKFTYDYFVKKKYHQSIAQRLGFRFPKITKGQRKLVWVHAVSVGETKAIASLVKMINQQLDHPVIVISSASETGHAEAKRSIPNADYHVYLPLDFRMIIRPIVRQVSPDLVILTESDFWYNFLKAAKDFGAVIALVNGKISEPSLKRFQKVPYFTKKLFSFFNLLCIQSKHYYERFKALGIDESKMKITGNIKFDSEFPYQTKEQLETWKKQFHITQGHQIVVVGSSHDPEEKLILEQMKQVWKELPSVKLIIVPRHPERFQEVASLLEKENIPYGRFSQLDSVGKSSKVLLIDTMGLLRKCYQLADLAIVAGSYTPKVGGHHILEPSWYGVPVIYGPFMHSQPELVEIIQEYKAGQQVAMKCLGEKVLELLKDENQRTSIGKNGLRMLKDIQGATQGTWDNIKLLLVEKRR